MFVFEFHIPTAEDIAAARAAFAQVDQADVQRQLPDAREAMERNDREYPEWREDAAAALARWRDRQ